MMKARANRATSDSNNADCWIEEECVWLVVVYWQMVLERLTGCGRGGFGDWWGLKAVDSDLVVGSACGSQ